MNAPSRAPYTPAAVRSLRNRVETQARHIEIIEQRLHQTMDEAGLHSQTIELLPSLPRHPITQYQQRVWKTVTPNPAPAQQSETPGAAWWPRSDTTAPALTPAPGWGCYEISNQTGKVLGISVFGLEEQRLAEILQLIASQQRKTRDFTPVFLTSSTAFHLFRRYGFVFEYLPAAARREGVAGQQDWHDYAAQRLELICSKWGIVRVICFSSQTIGSW